MKRMATRAELSAALIELYDELQSIQSRLSYLIDDEVNENMKKRIKRNAAR